MYIGVCVCVCVCVRIMVDLDTHHAVEVISDELGDEEEDGEVCVCVCVCICTIIVLVLQPFFVPAFTVTITNNSVSV